MNKSSTFKRAVLIGTLCLGTAGWAVAQYGYGTPNGTPELQSQGTQTRANPAQPARNERASRLIGMDVKNANGHVLGKIHDIVLNPKTGQVAYYVLGVSGGFFAPQKLVAVPFHAFKPAATGDFLTLNASRANLKQAEGLTADNWPSATKPVWGAKPFWQEHKNKGGSESTMPMMNK